MWKRDTCHGSRSSISMLHLNQVVTSLFLFLSHTLRGAGSDYGAQGGKAKTVVFKVLIGPYEKNVGVVNYFIVVLKTKCI